MGTTLGHCSHTTLVRSAVHGLASLSNTVLMESCDLNQQWLQPEVIMMLVLWRTKFVTRFMRGYAATSGTAAHPNTIV
jgi:hypothetical protein